MKTLPVLIICMGLAGGAWAAEMRPGSAPVRRPVTQLACHISTETKRFPSPPLVSQTVVATNTTTGPLGGGMISYSVITDAGVRQGQTPIASLAPGASVTVALTVKAHSCAATYL